MKRVILQIFILFGFFGLTALRAELPNGSEAKDWTLTDINGNVHNLYSVLESGRPAIIDFSATWCGPCWNYHNQGILEALYDEYGPSGTDELRVYFIEPDLSTNTQCLYGSAGCVGGTQGDWVTGTPYPIIDLNSSTAYVDGDYAVTYYPTLYAISPDKRTWEVGQSPKTTWEHWLFQSFTLDATADVTPAPCAGYGAIDLNVSGGYNSKSYSWSNGASSEDLTGLDEGIYSVRVFDNNGYYIDREYTVGGPTSGQPLAIQNIDSYGVDCNGNATGYISLQGAGGNYGYQYSWSNGETSSAIYDLVAGDYTVVVTDAAGCSTSEVISIDQPDPLFIVSLTNPDQCGSGVGDVSFVPYGGTGPFTYDIGEGSTTQSYFIGLAAGTYTVESVDNNGCTFTDEFTIEDAGSPVAMAQSNGSLSCTVTQVTVSGSGSSSGIGISYAWSTTDGHIVSGGNTLTATVDQPGTYTLTVTNTQYGCSSTEDVVVVSTATPPAAQVAAPSPLTCAATSIQLDGSGSSSGAGISYAWTTADGNIVSGENTATPTVNAAGTYTLTVSNSGNGCNNTTSVVVTADQVAPSLSVSNGEITCAQQSVEICASAAAGSTVVWSTADGPVESNCITVSSIGTFTATATGANGCVNSASSTVTGSSDVPQVTSQANGAITCTVPETTVTGTVEGDLANYNILWTTANGTIQGAADGLTITVTSGGTYTMTATNIASGCAASTNVNVDADLALPQASYDYSQSNGTLTLTNTSSVMDGEIVWDLGNGETATGSSVEISYPATGVYNICVTVTNECGPSTHCEEVQFISALSHSVNIANVVCNGDNNGSLTAEVSGGLPEYVISWTGPNGFTSSERSINNLAPGQYTLVITDAAGNATSETYTITEPTQIQTSQVTIEDATDNLANGAITLNATGGTGTLNILWSNGATGRENTGLAPGEYSAVITDDNGCSKEVGPFVVRNATGISELEFVSQFSMSPNPTSTFVNLNVSFTKNLNSKVRILNNIGQLVWSKSFNASSIAETIDVSHFNTGLYMIEVTSNQGRAAQKLIIVR